MFFEVIPTEIFRDGSHGILTYSSDLDLRPGHLVLIPLGSRTVPGIVLQKSPEKPTFACKPISSLLHPIPLPAHLLKSILWLSEYYLTPLPLCAKLIVPKLSKTSQIAPQAPNSANSLKLPLIPLTKNQQNALRALQEAPGATRLLRGVTGSGKTNIYLKMAADSLKREKSVILLVPEIALTSQLVQIFEQTFGDRVALIHSNQTIVERRTTWLNLLETTSDSPKTTSGNPISASANPSHDVKIIIGPRSALFAPVANLGLIIIDESHESAYYQDNSPRYSALRLASFIASTLKIPCLQGSATPSITDFYLAQTKNTLVSLDVKAKSTAKPPDIHLIDLKNRDQFTKNRYLSTPLLAAITKNLQNGHQTLIFHNRRGSAPFTICEECGWQALCYNCHLPLILHADGYRLECHICGDTEKVPPCCPHCGRPGIIHKGFGTKLLESELKKLFEGAKIARFDGDNKKSEQLAYSYDDVKSGKIQILIGTQTLARGLDLPHLATVGIIQADAGLSLPDFAAEERTFQLLTQVIGRVGRGHLDHTEVFVQTYQPDHFAIQSALTADFPQFAATLLKKRRQHQLPPFTYLARLSITYKTERTALDKIRAAADAIQKIPGLQVSSPLPAFHEHTAKGYTWQLTVRSTSRARLLRALAPYAKYHLELDPPSLL